MGVFGILSFYKKCLISTLHGKLTLSHSNENLHHLKLFNPLTTNPFQYFKMIMKPYLGTPCRK